MKKNKTMRLASVLLVMVLLSTCVIGGTFAKYTRQINKQDSARVARWGFNGTDADIAITNLFMNAYGATVKSKDGADVIAPGTGNTATFKFKFVGGSEGATAPEVTYKITVDASDSECDARIQENSSILWAVVEGEDIGVEDIDAIDAKDSESKEWGSWTAMIAEIESLDSKDGKNEYAPGNLPPVSENFYTVAWKWVIDGNDTGDTAMGNVNSEALDNVVLSIKITATQVN